MPLHSCLLEGVNEREGADCRKEGVSFLGSREIDGEERERTLGTNDRVSPRHDVKSWRLDTRLVVVALRLGVVGGDETADED
jgi:hypothetical protein